jgi:putative hydrolase of the HAD superfamily
VGNYDQFSDFEGFFTKVYAHFATPKPWEIYHDVLPALKQWHQQGIELGVISNFDTRLYALLELLDLKQYFKSITISSTVGAAKPDSKIFITALQKHNCMPQEAWYIGDNVREDYEGAKSVGLQPFLIERPTEN